MKGKSILKIFGLILVVCLAGAVVFAWQLFEHPLGSSLNLLVAQASADKSGGTNVTSPTATAGTGSCGQTGSMIIQVIGRDINGIWNYPYGADSIHLVKINFDQGTISMFAIPRDLLLNTPSMSQYNLTQSKIGPLYGTVVKAESNSSDADIKATNAVAQTLYDNFGIKADHYVTVEESVLTNVIDTLGGIQVNVPEAITFTDQGKTVNIPAGEQTMNGATAQDYVRYLTNADSLTDEWGRFDRQSKILQAVLTKLTDASIYSKIPDLLTEFSKSIVTDLSPAQLASMACVAKGTGFDKIQNGEITKDSVTVQNDAMVLNDLAATKQTLQTFFQK